MKRPLSYALIAILLVSTISYSPAIACKSGQENAGTAVTPSSQPATGTCEAEVTVSVSFEPEPEDRMAAMKSSLRAGVAVGKAVGHAALVVANSMIRAARHAAVALVRTAYELA